VSVAVVVDMRVIFLDLDGVLVPDGQFPYFKSDLVENLKSVVDATSAKIVLSSDWRRQRHLAEQARRTLRAYGLDFIDCTPSLSHDVAQRPTEILQWKNEYSKSTSLSLSVRQKRISAWIAIDDRSLLEEQDGHELQGHFVQTKPKVGLDRSTAHKCIQLLHSQDHAANGLQSRLSKNESFISISTADTDDRHSLSTVENFDLPLAHSVDLSTARTFEGFDEEMFEDEVDTTPLCWLPSFLKKHL